MTTSILNELIYPYLKLRKDFGRQPRFLEDRKRNHANLKPSKNLRKRYRRIRLLDKRVQAVQSKSETPMNTIRRIRVDVGILHIEGGWPKDIDPNEPELVLRQRKKMEKEENFQLAMPIMYKYMYKNIRDNNAIELYQEHFPSKWKSKDKQKQSPKGVTISIFQDWSKLKRPVHKIDWAPNNVNRMLVSHLPLEFSENLRNDPANCYIWEVENASRPEAMIRSWGQVTDIHFHPKDYHSICGSCYDGTVQFWDTRVQSKVIACSPCAISHGKPAMSCSWINSKTNSEMMSVGMDGQVIWWDTRNLDEILDQTWLDPEKGHARQEMASPATMLEYEFSLPTKFITGTFDGHIMVMMKKGKTPNDRLILNYKGHIGPVHALKRNPMFIKNVLSVGDSSFRVFAEDCRESSCMWGAPKDEIYTHGAWVPSRPSVFGCTRVDGKVEMWDLLRDPARAYYVMKVAKTMLTHFAPGPMPSRLVAIGTDLGNVYLQRMSVALCTFEKRDKPKLASVFEREAHKEKNIEQRHREIRLRKRDKEKKDALQVALEKEREEFKAAALAQAAQAGGKGAFPEYKNNKKYDVSYEAKNNPQCLYERQFFEDLYSEMMDKGLDAWEEYKEVEVVLAPESEDMEPPEITAEDLMQAEDDDAEPGAAPMKPEAAAAPAAPAPITPAPAPTTATTSGGTTSASLPNPTRPAEAEDDGESAEDGDDEAEEGMTRQQYNYPPPADDPPTDPAAFPPPPGNPEPPPTSAGTNQPSSAPESEEGSGSSPPEAPPQP